MQKFQKSSGNVKMVMSIKYNTRNNSFYSQMQEFYIIQIREISPIKLYTSLASIQSEDVLLQASSAGKRTYTNNYSRVLTQFILSPNCM